MKQWIKNHKKQLFLFLFCLIISFFSLLICTKNSPLYPFNNWVDENVFFTVGKGWAHGLIPYKDLFEQKGPLLYLLFMIGYFMSNHSFFGIFILEVISLSVCLYYVYKISKLFLKGKYAIYILPLFSAIVVSSSFFVHGGSAEEFCFPLVSISFYYLLRHFTKRELSYKELFINGFIAGCISMIKFNLLGFWFAFMMSIFISTIKRKQIKKSLYSCAIFLLGMSIPILVFCFYFISVHGFREFIDAYILFNIGGYTIKMSVMQRLMKIFNIVKQQVSASFIIFNLIDVGVLYFILNSKLIKSILGRISIVLVILFSAFGIYWGTYTFPYYFLFLVYFIVLGLIALFYQLFNHKNLSKTKYSIIFLIILLISILQLMRSNNISFMKNKKEDLVQYKFAEVINKKKNPTLLNYGALDGGFYFAADVIPNTVYFHALNGIVPNMQETLLEEISSQKFDFIVIRCYGNYDPRNQEIYDHYKLKKKEKEELEGIKFTYYLYEKK